MRETSSLTRRHSLSVIFIAFSCLIGFSACAQTPSAPILITDDTVDPPPASDGATIPGYTSVTIALEPTGSGRRYDIGGGDMDGNELSDVPWQSLRPGDVVNIYFRNEPYRHKFLLSEQGTESNPIVINGVTNAEGDRPTISGSNAVTINPDEWHPAFSGSIILLNRRWATGTYGINAAHYRIMNLRITGARPPNTYTFNGTQMSYEDLDRGIWSAGGQYIEIQGMIFDNNGSGIFTQANDDPGSLSKTWTIRGSKFENNGNGARDHQVYLQAVSDPGEFNVVEGNFFGPPTPNQDSIAQLKVRSTGTIVRYNWFNSAHRTLDIVEAQDAIPDWMYRNYSPAEIRKYYRSSYVYGNVFVNDLNATGGEPAARPLHFGADSLGEDATWGGHGSAVPSGESGMRGYESPTYFFHNTFYMRGFSDDIWRGVLFDAENNSSPVTPTPGTVEAWNNIIEFNGDTRIGLMNRSGTVLWRGTNLVYSDTLTILAESDAFANVESSADDSNVDIVQEGAIITASAALADAQNANLALKDFNLTDQSPAIDAAETLPQYLQEFPVDNQPNGQLGGTRPRITTDDLGALEFNE